MPDSKEYKKKYRLTHKEKIKEHKKKYRLKNKEKIKKWNKRYRIKNREKIRKYIKKYFKKYYKKNKEYFILYQKKYSKTKEYKKRARERAKKYNKNNPLKNQARHKLRNAVVAGKIIKPKECSNCRNETKIEAHHSDYSKPLEVIWLCKLCHRLADKKMLYY